LWEKVGKEWGEKNKYIKKKAILSATCISVFVFLNKTLESLFEINSRFEVGLGSIKKKLLAIYSRHFR
jgi:hypothetical protein